MVSLVSYPGVNAWARENGFEENLPSAEIHEKSITFI
jgi:hypothetical protein